MKNFPRWTPLAAILVAALGYGGRAAEPPPPSTAFTRTLLRATTAAQARAILNINDSTVSSINNQTKAAPRALTLLSSWDVVDCILTNSGIETIMYEASVFNTPKSIEVIYGVWTNGFASPNRGYIAAAVGANLHSLTKIGPIISPGLAGQWDSAFVSPGRIWQESGTNYLTYFGGTNLLGFERPPSNIGIAYSTDGTNWTKAPANPILTVGPATWEDSHLYVSSPIKKGTNYFWFYNASGTAGSDGIEKIGLAVSTSILGPITKVGPVIEEGFGAQFTFASDPQIVALNEGLWGMLFRATTNLIGEGRSGIATAYSLDLTNWFGSNTLGDFRVTLRSYHPLVDAETTELYGGGFFEDNGSAILMDDLHHVFVLRPTQTDLIPPGRLGSGANGFPLTSSTVLLTNPVASQGISLIKNWNGSTIFNALGFNFQSTANELYMDTNGMAFNTHGATDFRFDQGLTVIGSLRFGGTIDGNGGSLTNVTAATLLPPAVTTQVTRTNALAVGWPAAQTYYTLTNDCALTNVTGIQSGAILTGIITLSNSTAATFGIFLPAQWRTPDGSRVYYVTNGQMAKVTVEWSATPWTNAAWTPLY